MVTDCFTTRLARLAAAACLAVLALPAQARIAETLPNCSWDRPGVDPFMGDVVAAVDRYADIPADVRGRLKQRMAARRYDEIVGIRRDRIVGRHRYDPAIREMHFGEGRVCRSVTRERWTDAMQERGLVYCESGHCILVPTVCRNVSRITRLDALPATLAEDPPGPVAGGTPAGGAAAAPEVPAVAVAAPPAAPGSPGEPAGSSFADGVADPSPLPGWGGSAPGGGAPLTAIGGGNADRATRADGPFVGWPSPPPALPPTGGFLPGPVVVGGGGAGGSGGAGSPPVFGGGGADGPIHGGGGLPPVIGGGGAVPPVIVGGGAAIPPVPEPSTVLLMLAGLAAVAAAVRRRAR